MNTVPLSNNMADPATVFDRSPGALVVGEICERVLELAEMKGERWTAAWLVRMAGLAQDPECPRALWLYVRLSTGDLGQITNSFSGRGNEHCRSKQAEQQENEHALRVIQRHYPELGRAITELLARDKKRE